MAMNRFRYGLLGIALIVVGLGIGYLYFYLDTGNFGYALTLNPSGTTINISTSNPTYSIIIFASGAVFSAGLSIFTFLLQPSDRKARAKG
jgi:hypothetical protein